MRYHYYRETDSLYVDLSEKPSARSREVVSGIVLDFDAEDVLVGIDVDHARQKGITAGILLGTCIAAALVLARRVRDAARIEDAAGQRMSLRGRTLAEAIPMAKKGRGSAVRRGLLRRYRSSQRQACADLAASAGGALVDIDTTFQ